MKYELIGFKRKAGFLIRAPEPRAWRVRVSHATPPTSTTRTYSVLVATPLSEIAACAHPELSVPNMRRHNPPSTK